MFGLLKTKNDSLKSVQAVYRVAVQQSRQPFFYTDLDVPDTMDGRFDLLLLHLYLIYERLGQEDLTTQTFNQALFDIAFSDMDQSLREVGIGDMGIPKHMKRMMQGFNGRFHVYLENAGHKEKFCDALRRNVYGTAGETPDEKKINALYDYILEKRHRLSQQNKIDIINGILHF